MMNGWWNILTHKNQDILKLIRYISLINEFYDTHIIFTESTFGVSYIEDEISAGIRDLSRSVDFYE